MILIYNVKLGCTYSYQYVRIKKQHIFKSLPRILITLALLPQVPGVASHGPLTPNLLQVAGHRDCAGRDDCADLDDHAGQDNLGDQDDNSESDDYVDHDAEAD